MKRFIPLLVMFTALFAFSCDNGGSDSAAYDETEAMTSIINMASSYGTMPDNGDSISMSFEPTDDDKTIYTITFDNYTYTDSIYGQISVSGTMEVTYWQVNSEGSSVIYVEYSADMTYTGTPFTSVTMDYDYTTTSYATSASIEITGTITIDGTTYNL